MPHPAAPLADAVPLHAGGPAHEHGAHGHRAQGHGAHGHGDAAPHDHAHDHAPGHSHAHDPAPAPTGTLPASLLMAGAGSRLLGTLGLLALLWTAVAWALGESA